MVSVLLLLLIVAWFFGYIQVPGLFIPNFTLFTINGQTITLINLIIFALIAWAIGILPSPLRQIAAVILLIWVLSTLGIIAISGLSSLLVIAIIIGLVVSLLGF